MTEKYQVIIKDLTLNRAIKLRDTLYESELLSEHEQNNLGFEKVTEKRR